MEILSLRCVEQSLREVNYASRILRMIQIGDQLKQGLCTTDEALQSWIDTAARIESLQEGDRDLVTGQTWTGGSWRSADHFLHGVRTSFSLTPHPDDVGKNIRRVLPREDHDRFCFTD